jgi:hypothetical protein
MWDRALATVKTVKEGIVTIIVKGSSRGEVALRWGLGAVVGVGLHGRGFIIIAVVVEKLECGGVVGVWL